MKVVAGKLALGTADIWVPNDGMQIAPPQRLCRFLVAWWVLGRDEERGNSRAYPRSCAWSSCFEDSGERFQTLIPFCTSPLVFSSSAFPQEDELKLTKKDKGSEVCANVCSDALNCCKAAFMGISERLLAAPLELSSEDAHRTL